MLEDASRTTLKSFRPGKDNLHPEISQTSSTRVGKVTESLGWKAVLLIQFQQQVIFAVHFGIVFSYIVVIYEVGLALAVMETENLLAIYMTDTKGIVYSFDAFYMVDVIFMIIYKNIDWPEVSHRYKSRNVGILTMELLTLVPVDTIYYSIARTKEQSTVALLRLRYVFRMIRLFYDYRIPSPTSKGHSMIRVAIKAFVGIGLICSTLAVAIQLYLCKFKCLQKNINNTFYYNLYVASEKITGKGFGKTFYHDTLPVELTLHIFSFTGFVAYLMIGYIVSKMICTYISKDKLPYSYLIRYTSIKEELDEWKKRNASMWRVYDECLYNTIEGYYRVIWDKHRWYVTKPFTEQILPVIKFKEVYLDISWNAFKHSHLFRNQKINFLREISNYMNHAVYAPGEVIYSRHRQKSGMLYIRTGIVQILSVEDGETAIISFSGGTCLGESSLFIDYESNWSVVCKTYCEVSFLKRQDFVRISQIYPRIYRKLAKVVQKRYREANKFKRLAEYQWHQQSITNPDTITLLWLKKILHQLIKNDTESKDNNSLWNENLTFCPDYLDLLVITKDIELVSDTIFVKKKFPSIFQPESIFLDGWNIFIGIVAINVLLLYPCYMIYCNELSSTTHMVTLTILTFIWCTDLYIQSSTAVRTKDMLYVNISSIIYYRLTNTGFLVDLFSTLPFSVFIAMIDRNISYQRLVLTESHKLLKAYRVNFIFTKIEMLRLMDKVILKYVKVFMIDFFLFYYTAIFFYYIMCDRNDKCPDAYSKVLMQFSNEPTKYHMLLHLYTSAALFLGNMTFLNFLKYITYGNVVFVIFLQFIYLFFSMFTLAYTAIMETLRESKVHQYKEFVSTVDIVLKDLNVSQYLQKRIWLYLKGQFWVDKGLRVLNPMLFQNNMSYNLYSLTSQVRYGKFLNGIPLFAELDECIIIDATRKLQVTHYPPDEVITYAGEVCKEMHVIEFGFCKVLGSEIKILEPSDSFCVIETCMQIPTFYTIVTLTDCKVLSMSYIEYARLATRYPEFGLSVTQALSGSVTTRDIYKIQSTYRALEKLNWQQESKNAIFRSFKWQSLEEKRQYFREFPSFAFCFKRLLMRHTFPTYGVFLFYWEITRVIFAFFSSLLSSYPEDGYMYYFSLCVDVTAWVDLYVRHHVCYYNEEGIEVSHPAKTSVHYWQHGLLIDFLACVPLDYLFSSPVTKSYLRINRFLQLHRVFGFIRYINNNNICRSKLFDAAKYIPMVFLAVEFLSKISMYITCSLDNINFENSTCIAEKWAGIYLKDTNSSTIMKQHAASLLITTMTLTMISFLHTQLISTKELWITNIMLIAGHIFFVWVTARMVSNSFYRKTDLTGYQEAMRNLLSFVSARKIDKNIKNEIIAYYEFMWKKTKGKNLVLLLSSFSTAIKEDILYDMFGKNISTSIIFPVAPISFFKSLLLESKYEVYVHKGIIYRVNDVHGFIYILLKGTVDVLGADYNKLLILTPGSAFGNLDNCLESRQTLSMIAKGPVEVLKISSIYFHGVISKYPTIMNHFKRQTCFNVDYIENKATTTFKYSTMTIQSVAHDTPHKNQKPTDGIKKRRSLLWFKLGKDQGKGDAVPYNKQKSVRCSIFFKVLKETGWVRKLQLIITSISCFFGFHLELYQLNNYDNNIVVISLLYFCDFLYIMKIYLHFHTRYVNETGVSVTNIQLIAKYYLHQTFGFYFDLASAVPLELISLFFINQHHFWPLWSWLRKNRLIRIIYFLHLLKESQEKLHVNVKAVRIIYMVTWLTVLLQSMSTLVLMVHLFNVPELSDNTKFSLLIRSYEIIFYAASCAAITDVNLIFDIYSVMSAVLLMCVCKFFITLFIAEMCSLIQNVHQNKTKYRIFTLYLKSQLKEEGVSLPLQKGITEYLNLLWIHHRGIQFPGLLSQAPYYLKEAILNAMYGFHLRRHPLIRHCHTDLIRQMAATFDVLIFFPGDIVAYVGDIDKCMYFIHKGEVNALVVDTLCSEVIVDTLVTGDCFGLDQGLYKNCGHGYTYKVTKKSVIIALNKGKWFSLLQFFPASKRVLFELRNVYMYK